MANIRNKSLRLGLINARSLMTGRDELMVTVMTHTPDILAINETWLKPGEDQLAPELTSYKFIHRARQGKRGGGVGFYIKREITARIRQHPPSVLEQLWLEVQLPGVTMAIGTAYRPESVSISEALDSLSESVNSLAFCDCNCILGDLNIDVSRKDTQQARELITFSHQHNLTQLVTEHTRVTDCTETTLDIVLTDNSARCQGVKVIHNTCLSDHAMVLVDFNIKKPKPIKRVKYQRSLHDIDINSFTENLKVFPWKCIESLENVDDMIVAFNSCFLTLFDVHAPIRKKILKDKPKPWITDMLKFVMTLRDKALFKAQNAKTDASKEYYRSLKNLVTTMIRREKKSYFNNFINNNKNKPNVLWKNIKNVIEPKQINTIPEHLNEPDKINNSFLEIPLCRKIDPGNIFTTTRSKKIDLFYLKPTTSTEVQKIINNIKTKAAGHDSIDIDMINMTLDVTLPTITKIVNRSIETNKFPTYWKKAIVRPVPKKSQVNQLNDLRPISILPVLSKVLERVVLDQVINFVESMNIVPKFQSGFRQGHGTESAILNVTDDLIQASDEGLSSVMILLDYSRAFDCLHPELLLSKLEYYGFSKRVCEWFRTFLTDREQAVLVEDKNGEYKYSRFRPIPRGVPQGSLLSPALFTIFTADITNHIKSCKYHLYADDTQLYYSFENKDLEEALTKVNQDLERIYTWSQNNSLVLNPSKSKLLLLGTKHQIKNSINCTDKIKINDVVLEPVTSAKNLGLIMDGELNFVEHVNSKIRTAYFKLKILYKIRPHIREELRLLLTESLVLSQLSYCGTVFGPRLSSGTKLAIQRVQNACIRFCYNVPRREYITPYLNKKNILNMDARRELQYACTVHRVIWNKKPEYLFEKISWYKDMSTKSLRSATQNMVRILPHKTTRYRSCFRYRAAKIWNDLPPPMKNKMTTECFRAKYKSALLRRQCVAENLKHAYWKDLDFNLFLTNIK